MGNELNVFMTKNREIELLLVKKMLNKRNITYG